MTQLNKTQFFQLLKEIDKTRFWELTVHYPFSDTKDPLKSTDYRILFINYKTGLRHTLYENSFLKGQTAPTKDLCAEYQGWAIEYYEMCGLEFLVPEEVTTYSIRGEISPNGCELVSTPKILIKKGANYNYPSSQRLHHYINPTVFYQVWESKEEDSYIFDGLFFNEAIGRKAIEKAMNEKLKELKDFLTGYLGNLPSSLGDTSSLIPSIIPYEKNGIHGCPICFKTFRDASDATRCYNKGVWDGAGYPVGWLMPMFVHGKYIGLKVIAQNKPNGHHATIGYWSFQVRNKVDLTGSIYGEETVAKDTDFTEKWRKLHKVTLLPEHQRTEEFKRAVQYLAQKELPIYFFDGMDLKLYTPLSSK